MIVLFGELVRTIWLFIYLAYPLEDGPRMFHNLTFGLMLYLMGVAACNPRRNIFPVRLVLDLAFYTSLKPCTDDITLLKILLILNGVATQ